MAKKRTPKKTVKKPAAKPTKGTGKPAKRSSAEPPLARPVKSPAKDKTVEAAITARKPVAKSTQIPAKDKTVEAAITARKPVAKPTQIPTKNTTIETVATISVQATEEAKPEHIWVVWQDGRGIWVGTSQEFKHSKRPETIVCDVIDRGAHQGAAALHRAIQLGQTLRRAYADHMKSWLQYDDVAQRQRIQDWYERLGEK